MLLLKYHELTGTPTWSLIRNHFHLFNEEVGEISLSVLSRLQKPVLNKKPDVEHWDKQYKLSKVYQSVDDSVNKKKRDSSGIRGRPIKIKNHAETIQKTQVFLEALFRAAGSGTFTMLTGPNKKWDSTRYKGNKWQKETPVGRTKSRPMFKKDISDIMRSRWRLVEKDTGSHWAATEMAVSWPEFAQGLDAAVVSNAEEPGGEEGDDGSEDALIDNAGEGDEDGEFLLPGLEETSEESEEDVGAIAIQEQELYMSQFVDASDNDADQPGGDRSSSDGGSSGEVEDPEKGAAKKGKRRRV